MVMEYTQRLTEIFIKVYGKVIKDVAEDYKLFRQNKVI